MGQAIFNKDFTEFANSFQNTDVPHIIERFRLSGTLVWRDRSGGGLLAE